MNDPLLDEENVKSLSDVIFDVLLMDSGKEAITDCFERLLPQVKERLKVLEAQLDE